MLLFFFRKILICFKNLGEAEIIHGNLRGEHVFLTEDKRIKVLFATGVCKDGWRSKRENDIQSLQNLLNAGLPTFGGSLFKAERKSFCKDNVTIEEL